MSLRSRLVFVALWVVSIVIVGVLVSAQSQQVISANPDSAAPVISGPDLGFRPDGWKGKARTGRFVVRINGEWVDAIESASFKPIPVVK